MKKLNKFIVCSAILLFALCSCSKKGGINEEIPKDPKDPTPPTELQDISSYKVGKDFKMRFQGQFVLNRSGIEKTDYLELVARDDASKKFKISISQVNDKGAVFQTPPNFLGGMYTFTFYKAGKAIDLGTTFAEVIDSTEVPKVAGSTTYGRVIDALGNPIAGVSVSDGVFVTTTDASGQYYLSSLKKMGYVFISVPSGYKTAINRTIPQFFQRLQGTSALYEQRNFILEAETNTRHRVIVFTDTHLANRTNDISQFTNGFKADFKNEIAKAKAEGVKLYALGLGDLTWDEYWYANSFKPADYYKLMEDLDIPIYNIPGNHDNDPYVADDFLSEKEWRTYLGPTYFSFNIGDIHYIQLDNTLFKNTGGNLGMIGDLSYTQGLTPDQLKWLEADLKSVPAGKTIVFGTHIQYTNRYKMENNQLTWSYSMPANFRTQIESLLEPYNVHMLSGHTHINYTNFMNDKLMERNIVAVCATWWWTGNYSGNKCHIARDGSPGGYEVLEVGETTPGALKWRNQAIGKSSDYQFRAYDLNNSQITRELYCPAIRNDFSKVSAEFFSSYANGYDQARSDNKVLINVFNWNSKWQLNVKEVETNSMLNAKQIDAYDPLHVIHFNMKRMNSNSTAMTFPTLLTSHMFEVTCSNATTTLEITATDGFGRSYKETMVRPRKLYDMSISSQW